ncbi:C25 family cysteine peptidase, partial [candidate division KSB1 bacterium]
KITYVVEFNNASRFLDESIFSENYLIKLPNYFLNGESIRKEAEEIINKKLQNKGILKSSSNQTTDYIIITHSNYDAAAKALAEWKSQLGYTVEIISKSSWTSSDVKNEIHSIYQNLTPKPDYFVIIGDHPDVPGEVLNTMGSAFASDLYYACMDGSNDFIADMAQGRITVSNQTEANAVIGKIINYEKNPVSDSNFYQTGLHAAYFQHAGSGYAERRFAQTAEDIRNYMTSSSIGFNIERVYYTESSVNPTNWNNGSYSAGEALPSYLLKPGFPWDGDNTDIKNGINAGRLYVLHRDHGSVNAWGDPYYTKTDINQLNNGEKLPVVFSINCLTGKYYETESFSERFLRKTPGGAVGVFCHAEVSYSGYNDALSMGCFDAIWATPGLVPNFTGSGGINNPSLSSHGTIVTMGDVVNQGLIRMSETWGVNQYTNELYHYFGDPAMRMWTDHPIPIAASHQDTVQCGLDSTLTITSSSCSNGLATFVVDGELVGKVQLVNGSGTITFNPVAGSIGLITVSKHNYKPYIDSIVITGGCPKALFTSNKSNTCIGDSIIFTDNSSGNITSYLWNFGSGAIPATDTSAGPHTVLYTTSGTKTVNLTITGPGGSHYTTKNITIDPICKYFIPPIGVLSIDGCTGKLFDNGGTGDYSNNTDGLVTISALGASSIILNFISFGFEVGFDYLYIYDGPNTNSTLIGQYDGFSLPNGGTISSSSGSITIRQYTDGGVVESGFELNFQCSYPNTAPLCDFEVSDTNSCNGTIDFIDKSVNGPSSWLWDFGDGNTSNLQHPTHTYLANGTYTVELISSNTYGSDTILKQNLITINMPTSPTVNDVSRCGPGIFSINATGNGTLCWYDSIFGGTLIDTGNTFITPLLNATQTYFVEDEIPGASQYVGKYDNSGGGGYLNYSHYLVFDCHTPFTLKTVKVYAGGPGPRTIELRNSSGSSIIK